MADKAVICCITGFRLCVLGCVAFCWQRSSVIYSSTFWFVALVAFLLYFKLALSDPGFVTKCPSNFAQRVPRFDRRKEKEISSPETSLSGSRSSEGIDLDGFADGLDLESNFGGFQGFHRPLENTRRAGEPSKRGRRGYRRGRLVRVDTEEAKLLPLKFTEGYRHCAEPPSGLSGDHGVELRRLTDECRCSSGSRSSVGNGESKDMFAVAESSILRQSATVYGVTQQARFSCRQSLLQSAPDTGGRGSLEGSTSRGQRVAVSPTSKREKRLSRRQYSPMRSTGFRTRGGGIRSKDSGNRLFRIFGKKRLITARRLVKLLPVTDTPSAHASGVEGEDGGGLKNQLSEVQIDFSSDHLVSIMTAHSEYGQMYEVVKGKGVFQNGVKLRYCRHCQMYQPLRAKHCVDCDRCVRTHDHHCPWLGTCVGERNRCVFYWYLVTEATELVWVVVEILHIMLNGPRNWLLLQIWLMVSAMVVVFIFFMVLCLLGYHTFLALSNITTWESLAWNKITYLKHVSEAQGSPFSHGVCSNLGVYCCVPGLPMCIRKICYCNTAKYGATGELLWQLGKPAKA